MAHLTMPTFGVQGLTEAEADKQLRVDFQPDKFTQIIETKGYRLAWSRAAMCPCAPVSTDTRNPDPNCPVCSGSGWYYFGPENYTVNQKSLGALSEDQLLVTNQGNLAVIKGVMTGLQTRLDPHDRMVGRWLEGTAQLTVRSENKLGYYDKVTNLDSLITYAQVIISKKSSELVAARYPIVQVNVLASLAKKFIAPTDFTLEDGKIKWTVGRAPAEGTRLSLHYLIHPVWLVVNHPHSLRGTFVNKKKLNPATPVGDHVELPIQAIVQYDFIPSE